MNKLFIYILLAFTLLPSCVSDDFDDQNNLIIDPVDISVDFDENGEPIPHSQNVYADAEHEAFYASMLFGNAWKWKSTYEILENGLVSHKEFWEGMEGGGPHQWWFNSSSLFTQYFYYDAQPALAFSKHQVTIDLRTGKVMTTGQNPTKLMHLVSLFDDNDTWHLITIEPLGIRSGKQIYGMNEYTLMSQQELNKYQTEYTFDWDEYRNSKK